MSHDDALFGLPLWLRLTHYINFLFLTWGRTLSLKAPALLEVFDAAGGQWSPVGGPRVELRLAAGGGRLVRIRP